MNMPSTTFSRQISTSETTWKEKLVTAAKEARKFSWADTGSAAISTANKGTSSGGENTYTFDR